jgi:pyruvate dehydrogenase E2 component (dihydrolipoamide acetyltransferase)
MPEVLMPRLSDTMQEGVLSLWLKQEGDQVRRGDVLAEIETDKATMELEAYDDGVLQRLLVAEGTTVPIGEPIAIIGEGAEMPASVDAASVDAAAPAAPAPAEEAQPSPPVAASAPGPPAAPPARADAQLRASPLARRLARDRGVDLSTVAGTGPGGRIVRADIEQAADTAAPAPAAAPAAPAPAAPAPAAPAATPVAPAGTAQRDDEEVPLTAVRRITAERLTQSAATPHFYLVTVVDADALQRFRAEVNERLAAEGTRVSVTDLLLLACARTLRAHPQANASWGGDKILRRAHVNVGVAVALEDGLIVPVVHDADRKSVGEIARETRSLAETARAGRLTPDQFSGGTFTISNLGMYGVDHFTAVINPPEAAILAVGAATQEPVVRGGEVTVRTTIKLTLSIDHRVLDGATAAEFLAALKATLEEPLRILL